MTELNLQTREEGLVLLKETFIPLKVTTNPHPENSPD